MKELHRTNNLPEISWLQSVLATAGIESVVLDGDTAQAYGSALVARRVMVLNEDFDAAEAVFAKAKALL